MTYLYKIECDTYDGGDTITLKHSIKFSKTEFEKMFVEATVTFLLDKEKYGFYTNAKEGEIPDLLMEKMKREHKEKEPDKKFKEFVKETVERWTYYYHYTTFSEALFPFITNVMIEKYGFEKIEYQQEISVDGLQQIVKEKEYKDYFPSIKMFNKITKKYHKLINSYNKKK